MAGPQSRRRRDAGDDALIRSVFAEHGGALLAYATRLAGDRGLAEDVVQETLLRVWRRPEVLDDGKGPVRAWLFTVARNLIIDNVRAKAARPTEVAERPTTQPAIADHADTVLDAIVVETALEKLSVEHREVVEQIYLRGRTVREAAETLGVAPGTVKSRSHYALRAMRKVVEDRTVATGRGVTS